jgi:hypothetical protein
VPCQYSETYSEINKVITGTSNFTDKHFNKYYQLSKKNSIYVLSKVHIFITNIKNEGWGYKWGCLSENLKSNFNKSDFVTN